jgi:thioester reductase-like protein
VTDDAARLVLITGGDGYLGRFIAERYLATSDACLLLWVRASSPEEFTDKALRLDGLVKSNRVRLGWGDLVSDDPFRDIPAGGVTGIVHAAAIIRFNVEAEAAQRVNVEGTEKLLRFASRCPGLERLALLSTIYSSGLRRGVVQEEAFDGSAGFANHYERSKWAAETALLTRFPQLPWQIFRVATVVADDDAGAVSQYNAFHNTLKLLYYGLISVVPGEPETPVYLVTARFAAESIVWLMEHGPGRTIYHVAHGKGDSATVGELLEIAFEVFERDEGFRLRGILKPLFADAESFNSLVDGLEAFGGSIVNQAVSSLAPFAPQLYVNKDIRNDNLVQHLASYVAPDYRALIQNTSQALMESRWGTRPTTHAVS